MEGQINGNPQCIYKKGASKQTVLHDAVESGDLDIVCFVLDIAKKHPPTEKHPPDFLNQRYINLFMHACTFVYIIIMIAVNRLLMYNYACLCTFA